MRRVGAESGRDVVEVSERALKPAGAGGEKATSRGFGFTVGLHTHEGMRRVVTASDPSLSAEVWLRGRARVEVAAAGVEAIFTRAV